jgi:hypothetical protein
MAGLVNSNRSGTSVPFAFLEEGRVTTGDAWLAEATVWVLPNTLREAYGWELKPEGLCRGDVCIPIGGQPNLVAEGRVNLNAFAAAMDRPLVVDALERAAYLGVSAQERADALRSLEAPDFSLPDLEGKLHTLREQRGKKVLLVAYASW